MTKVVLSRKGFDASAGGAASPLLPDGRLISLPIPEHGTGARYSSLRAPWGQSFADVMRQSGMRRVRMRNRWVLLDDGLEAHLDPDLVRTARPHRPPGWRPAFGQAGAAQTILNNAGVGAGDLFLFFGWFRDVRARPRRDLHVIWGWLRVGSVVTPSTALKPHSDHPHVVLPDRTNNTLYIAADEAFPGVPGAGVLPFGASRVLTAPGARGRADWLLPRCLHRAQVLPRHRGRFGENGRFDARYQWQEFVADGEGVEEWAEGLLRAI
ncbi:MAG: hypothetical protein GEU74_13410 [Nitriliruptorales bacterium]|nr:hypothetical protein [Nitriliruptorales bacterium]